MNPPLKPGKVWLVGVGPGSPDLVTVRAMRALAAADVWLVDDLVSPQMSCYASPGTHVEWVGKRGGRCSVSQARIQQLTLEHALAGHTVARVKGGDPLLFGRGGEEAAFLHAHGVPVEVVNGISSGMAAAQTLGIALTHRAHCHGVTFVTGHTSEHGSPDWQALVRGGAVLLPASTRHFTAAETGRQHHGELYLPPDRLRGHRHYGALRLDGAALAMLEALLAPALAPASAELLVRAIVGQVMASPVLPLPEEPASLALRLVRCFTAALEREQPLPSIDAVACSLGVSARQLQRACQLEFGASPVAVRRRVLATHARTLLAEGQPVARVSERLGFASSGHLARLLREVPPAR